MLKYVKDNLKRQDFRLLCRDDTVVDWMSWCCRQIMRQLLGAVEFIHSRNVVHRDLKVRSSIDYITQL